MKGSLSASEATKKQQCTLTNLYFGVLMFLILHASGLVFFACRENWPALLLWLVLLPCARWVGLRLSPSRRNGGARGLLTTGWLLA